MNATDEVAASAEIGRTFGLFHGPAARSLLTEEAVADLTAAAALSSCSGEELTDDQRAEILSLGDRSVTACAAALRSPNQYIAAAKDECGLAGYAIATCHAADDHELDWLMVHPDRHGSGIADALMLSAMKWLGLSRPMWLSVASHNVRAIRFYRRFGFATDQHARTAHAVPHRVMRRLPW